MRIVLLGVLDEVAEDSFVVVTDKEDFANVGDLGDGVKAVLDDGVTGDFEERLETVSWLNNNNMALL